MINVLLRIFIGLLLAAAGPRSPPVDVPITICANGLVGLTYLAGSPAVHLKVVDQTCTPIAPASVTVTQSGFVMTIVQDSTGFNVSSGAGPGGMSTLQATVNLGGVTKILWVQQ